MLKGVFITATGTDIGKTYVSALLLKELREKNINAVYYKPALSGTEEKDGKLILGDALKAVTTAKLSENPEDLVSFSFKTAVSPHLASRLENKPIKKEKILNDFKRLEETYDFILTEGCGGITCPLILEDKTLLLSEIITDLNLPIIIVADASLGTINHCLLTYSYARQNNIPVLGFMLNNFQNDNFLHIDNLSAIEKLTKTKVIATVSKNATAISWRSTHAIKELGLQ